MEPAAAAASQRIGQTLRDKWTLERLIGSGGMAAVYEARHRNGARAAVKLLHPEMSQREDVRERFRREGYAANKVAHRGAVQVLDDDVAEDGSAFLVMELLEGESLAARANRQNGIEVGELLGVMDEILDVLIAAHKQGIVHRDLKPDNIFLANDGRVKLLDFGIARVADAMPSSFKTKMGTALGTAPYMAPEQALGKLSEVDGRSDLFAVGATMFRLLARRRIHEAPSDAELLVAMATKPAPPLASVAPSVPPHVCTLVDRALAYLAERRYPDAATMQRDLRAVRAGEPPPHAVQQLMAGVNPWVTRPPRPPTMGTSSTVAQPAVATASTMAQPAVIPAPVIRDPGTGAAKMRLADFTSAPTSPDAPSALSVASTIPDPARAPTVPIQAVPMIGPGMAGFGLETPPPIGIAAPPVLPDFTREEGPTVRMDPPSGEPPVGLASPTSPTRSEATSVSPTAGRGLKRVLLVAGGLIGLFVAGAATAWVATRGTAAAPQAGSASAVASTPPAAEPEPSAEAALEPAADPAGTRAGSAPRAGSRPAEPARPAGPSTTAPAAPPAVPPSPAPAPKASSHVVKPPAPPPPAPTEKPRGNSKKTTQKKHY
jgi:serine/threonine-protein kinase